MKTVLRYRAPSPIESACRLATGRSAIFHLTQRWQPEAVYMPAYVPEGVIAPFKAAGTEIIFYNLDRQLRPNFDSLAMCMDHGQHHDRPVIVLLHYFGMISSVHEASLLAEQYGGIVLSDCAHCIPQGDTLISADVTLYSFNKFLPVADGALMMSRRTDVNLDIAEAGLLPLSDEAMNAYALHLEANGAIADEADHEAVEFAIERSERFYEDYYREIASDFQPRCQSSVSRSVEAATDFRLLKSLRAAKSDLLSGNLLPRFLLRRDQDCQFAFPIRCDGRKEEIAAALWERGIVASEMKDKWEHIPISDFSIESEFIEDHLLLPISESVELETLLEMSDIVNAF